MTNHPNPNIPNRLRHLMSEPPTLEHFFAARAALKMTQVQLAAALDMSERQIQYMEAGTQAVDRRTWYSLILLMAVNRAIE
jgi:DNA-binding XRE family transcriptional regulator